MRYIRGKAAVRQAAAFLRLASDSDHAHHAACVPFRSAVRKEQIRLAIRTPARESNRRPLQACIEKLPPVGLNQIEMQRRTDG